MSSRENAWSRTALAWKYTSCPSAVPTRVVLQATTRDVEGLANDHLRVGVGAIELVGSAHALGLDFAQLLVMAGFVRDDDLLAGHGQIDAHLDAIAVLVVPMKEGDEDVTSHDCAVIGLELRGARTDQLVEGVRGREVAIGDLQ
jgi:hypothetical protein